MRPQKRKQKTDITTLFIDIGEVLLTNGWDHHERARAAKHFKLDFAEMEDRHHLAFEIYEMGRLTLEQYLDLVLFYKKRPFSRADFWRFMCAQSKAYPEMIELITKLKHQHKLKIIVVSNEARELNAHRIEKFKLNTFVDAFVSSCFVHMRKPDADIFRLALDLAQAKNEQVIFIDNTLMFVKIAEELGIHSILHTDYQSTLSKLSLLGLKLDRN
jgi:putative hydrolase of the HAD superfamily